MLTQTFIFIFWMISSSFAAPFEQYTTPVVATPCKSLDFQSYFKAETAQTSIKRDNPSLKQANFGGKYLLLKNEMLLETRWFIADCSSGKFFHHELFGEAEFTPSSLLVVLHDKKEKAPLQHILWTGQEWSKIEVAEIVSPAITQKGSIPEPSLLLQNYDSLYSQFPAQALTLNCKTLDFDSYFRAAPNKKKILKNNLNLNQPNFAGHFLLLKTENLFETLWLIADCNTGKFLPEFLKGEAKFKANSELVVIHASDELPTLYKWAESQWIEVPDPIQNKKKKISNALDPSDSQKLWDLLPHRQSGSSFSFQKLTCDSQNSCSFMIGEGKNWKPETIPHAQATALFPILKKWGVENKGKYSLAEGHCRLNQAKSRCEVMTTFEN